MQDGSTAQNAGRAKLIEETLPLVSHVLYQVSARFPRHVDKEELVRAGVLGLVQAAHRFDPDKGVAFHHFAARRIRGAILDALRSNDWAPRSVRRTGRSIEAARARLVNRLGRTPTSAELAAELGVSSAELAACEMGLARAAVLALEAVVATTDDDDHERLFLQDVAPSSGSAGLDEELVDRELHGYLVDAVELLPERHRIVIRGYFLEGRTSAELARELGVTLSRISQLRTEAFAMLRAGIDAQYGDAQVRPSDYARAIATRRSWRSRLDRHPTAIAV